MLFTKTIIALALLSVGNAQPVTSRLARAPSDSVMRRAPYPYPDGEVRIAIKREFSSVPTRSKREPQKKGKAVNPNINVRPTPPPTPHQQLMQEIKETVDKVPHIGKKV